MSYDCTQWVTKTLDNLVIPCYLLNEWDPDIDHNDDGTVTYRWCEAELTGVVADGGLHVSEIDMSSEGSGSALHRVVEPALKQSTGKLVASRVWEGGDSVDILIVTDGVVETDKGEVAPVRRHPVRIDRTLDGCRAVVAASGGEVGEAEIPSRALYALLWPHGPESLCDNRCASIVMAGIFIQLWNAGIDTESALDLARGAC